MTASAAHNKHWQIFEVVFGVPILLALLLQWAVPLSLPRGRWVPAFILSGAVFMILGAGLAAAARRELHKYNQPTDPGQATRKIVTTGVYSFSRNPIYLGGAGMLAGLALAVNFPWGLIMLLPALAACQTILILPEERYLTQKFGGEYQQYRASVRRWVGRTRHHRSGAR